jgi:hypothetical protein
MVDAWMLYFEDMKSLDLNSLALFLVDSVENANQSTA